MLVCFGEIVSLPFLLILIVSFCILLLRLYLSSFLVLFRGNYSIYSGTSIAYIGLSEVRILWCGHLESLLLYLWILYLKVQIYISLISSSLNLVFNSLGTLKQSMLFSFYKLWSQNMLNLNLVYNLLMLKH